MTHERWLMLFGLHDTYRILEDTDINYSYLGDDYILRFIGRRWSFYHDVYIKQKHKYGIDNMKMLNNPLGYSMSLDW